MVKLIFLFNCSFSLVCTAFTHAQSVRIYTQLRAVYQTVISPNNMKFGTNEEGFSRMHLIKFGNPMCVHATWVCANVLVMKSPWSEP